MLQLISQLPSVAYNFPYFNCKVENKQTLKYTDIVPKDLAVSHLHSITGTTGYH